MAQNPALKSTEYFISETDGTNRELYEFAVNELKSRSRSNVFITNPELGKKGHKTLEFIINTTLSHTYCIKHSANKLILEANNLENGKWLVYQFIEALSQNDTRVSASDLPPSYINFITHCNSFDFEYREPLFPTNLKAGNTEIFGTNSVDSHWGLWGHNLSKITNSAPEIFAEINGKKTENQFCFTSELLYGQVTDFIVENYGNGDEKTFRFVIMPEDNDLVCCCPNCDAIGNSNKNATPAISGFISKLATQFPNHLFFTSSYRTTKELPESALPNNTGVFLSTIDLPQGTGLSKTQKTTQNFLVDLANWKNLTPHVYAWDYAANFDDYLTPAPFLYSLQKRLLFFKEEGIKGVFFNGSGYDYASFEDLKTYISSMLMQTNNVDIDHFIRAYFKKFYPEFHQLLSNYYIQLEKDFSVTNASFNMYGGMKENLNSYFDKESFLKFYDDFKVLMRSKNLNNEDLKKLWVAMNFTKLQIAYEEQSRANGFVSLEKARLIPKKHTYNTIENLKLFRETDNLNRYREENGYLNTYISDWKYILKTENLENQLLNKTIQSNSIDHQDQILKLTDAIPGFPSDYHMGWFITDKNIQFQFQAPKQGKQTVQLRFIDNGRHQFYPPEDISIQINDVTLDVDFKTKEYENLIQIEFDIYTEKEDKIILAFKAQDKVRSKIAIDEIRIL